MSKPLISIIIPVYNSTVTLPRCLESLFSQTLSNIEIICVNVGSTDNSLALLKRYQAHHPNFLVINQTNTGPSAARNAGIAIASGKYLAFVDSDDYIEANMYETMCDIAESNELKLVMCSFVNDYTDRASSIANFPLPSGCIMDKEIISRLIYPELMKDGIFNGPCNKIYLRSFVKSLNAKMPEELRYGEDLVFQLELFDKLDRMYFINFPFYHYVHRQNSLSAAHGNLLESALIPMYLIRKHYAQHWGLPLEAVCEYFVYYSLMDLVNTISPLHWTDKRRILLHYLHNQNFSNALTKAKLHQKAYTPKIKLLYLFCRLLRLKTR